VIKEAAEIAGFKTVFFIYETTAVAIAYSKDKIKGQ
jgi:molecular chaperone DnaK (HSP70)